MAFTATFNRTGLIDRVLKKNRVVGTGQSATAEQTAYVDDVIDGAFDELSRKRIVSLAANGTNPAGYLETVADFVWLKVRKRFGRPDSTRDEMLVAEAAIRAIDADQPTFQPLKVSRI